MAISQTAKSENGKKDAQMTSGQMKALTVTVSKSVPADLGKKTAEKLEHKNYLSKKLARFWKETKQEIEQFFSNLFERVEVIFVTEHSNSVRINEQLIKELFIDPVYEREKTLGNKEPCLQETMWRKDLKYYHKEIPGMTSDMAFTTYQLMENLMYGQIIAEAQRLDVMKSYTWLEAILIAREIVLTGKLDTDGLWLCIFFKMPDDDCLHQFSVGRTGKYINMNASRLECKDELTINGFSKGSIIALKNYKFTH